jgi:uncharacterized Zn-binding protein involved in type VI secretion
MLPAARIGDQMAHGGVITSGFPTVLIEKKPAARMGDMHTCPFVNQAGPVPIPHVGALVVLGAMNVLTGLQPQARQFDQAICIGPPDSIVGGAFTVVVGMAATGGGGMGAMLGAMASAIMAAIFPPFPRSVLLPDGTVATVYATRDDAARAALAEANPQSISENREFGGNIYEHPDGGFGYTGPGRGSPTGFDPSSTPIPEGTTLAGDYHTHGDYSVIDPATGDPVRTSDPAHDDYNSDGFSQTDIDGITSDAEGRPGYTGYLGTPSGTSRRYDPATGTDSEL